MRLFILKVYIPNLHWRPSINDVTHFVGKEGDQPKGDIIPYAYLVKWVTRGSEESKISRNG